MRVAVGGSSRQDAPVRQEGAAAESASVVRIRDTAAQDRELLPAERLKRHRMSLLIALALMVGVGALSMPLLRFAGAHASVARSQVRTAVVQRGSVLRDVQAEGQVVAAVSPTLYAPGSGIVTLNVHAGDVVSKGQVVAVIDSTDLQVQLRREQTILKELEVGWRRAELESHVAATRARSALEGAEVDSLAAARELERSRKAFESGAISELQYQRAQDEAEKAQAALRHAKTLAELQPRQSRFDIEERKNQHQRQSDLVAELRRQIEALQVRSPVDGTVGQVQVADRATVLKDAPLLSVVDLSALEVRIQVPEYMARDLQVDMPARLQTGGRQFPARISAISPDVNNGEVAARLRFEGTAPEKLRQGQRLSARITLARRDDVLTVERGSLREHEGDTHVYIVREGMAERRPVRIGIAGVEKVEIVHGLAEGDEVVVSGMELFDDAERVVLAD